MTQFLVYSGTISEQTADYFHIDGVRSGYSIGSGFGLKRMQSGYKYYVVVTYRGGSANNKAIPKGKYVQNAVDNLETALDSVAVKPAMLMVENEENYNINCTISEYEEWFKSVHKIGKDRGIPVVNGGTTQPIILAIAYGMLAGTGQFSEAEVFKKRNKISKAHIASAQWVLTEMELLRQYTDTWNFHWQFKNVDSVNDFNTCIEACRYYGFLNVGSNELALQVTDPKLVVSATQAALGLSFAGWYNAVGEMGKAKIWTQQMIDAFTSVAKF